MLSDRKSENVYVIINDSKQYVMNLYEMKWFSVRQQNLLEFGELQ